MAVTANWGSRVQQPPLHLAIDEPCLFDPKASAHNKMAPVQAFLYSQIYHDCLMDEFTLNGQLLPRRGMPLASKFSRFPLTNSLCPGLGHQPMGLTDQENYNLQRDLDQLYNRDVVSTAYHVTPQLLSRGLLVAVLSDRQQPYIWHRGFISQVRQETDEIYSAQVFLFDLLENHYVTDCKRDLRYLSRGKNWQLPNFLCCVKDMRPYQASADDPVLLQPIVEDPKVPLTLDIFGDVKNLPSDAVGPNFRFWNLDPNSSCKSTFLPTFEQNSLGNRFFIKISYAKSIDDFWFQLADPTLPLHQWDMDGAKKRGHCVEDAKKALSPLGLMHLENFKFAEDLCYAPLDEFQRTQKLESQMELFYDHSDTQQAYAVPSEFLRPDFVCAVLNEISRQYQRCEVLLRYDALHCRVRLIDYGAEMDADCARLHLLKAEFVAIPPMTHRGRLANILAINQPPIGPAVHGRRRSCAIDELNEVCTGHTALAIIRKVQNGFADMDVFCPNIKKWAGDHLISKGVALLNSSPSPERALQKNSAYKGRVFFQ